MKKIIAILLSVLCIAGLFCGCDKNIDDKSDKKAEKATFNFGGCGIEFGMTKEEVNEIGAEVTQFGEDFDIDNSLHKDFITQKSFINIFTEGATKEFYPKVFYYFDKNDKLYCINFSTSTIPENDAETLLNNVMSTYGEEDEYLEGEFAGLPAFIYEGDDIQVHITLGELIDTYLVDVYLTAPGYEPPCEK